MSVSTRTRFEILKRDRFTCAYCGRRAPDVLLHVDHITPIAAGGTDDPINLITSCSDCNLGKSAVLLDETSRPTVTRREINTLEERVEQARAYIGLVQESEALADHLHDVFTEAWASAYGATLKEQDGQTYWVLPGRYERWPSERSVRTILRRLPIDRVLEAIDITEAHFNYSSQQAARYFYGVCWRMIRERQE